jgi:PTS system nitrogen regulatory IIA component
MKNQASPLTAWMQPEQIHLDVPLSDVRHALAFIADAIAAHHHLEAGPIFRALSRREQAGSTALGGGFAIPHARIPGIDQPLTVLVRARQGIEFDAPDHAPVKLMLAIVVPAHGDTQDHLELLALISEVFSQRGLRAQLDEAVDTASVARAISVAAAQCGQ